MRKRREWETLNGFVLFLYSNSRRERTLLYPLRSRPLPLVICVRIAFSRCYLVRNSVVQPFIIDHHKLLCDDRDFHIHIHIIIIYVDGSSSAVMVALSCCVIFQLFNSFIHRCSLSTFNLLFTFCFLSEIS